MENASPSFPPSLATPLGERGWRPSSSVLRAVTQRRAQCPGATGLSGSSMEGGAPRARAACSRSTSTAIKLALRLGLSQGGGCTGKLRAGLCLAEPQDTCHQSWGSDSDSCVGCGQGPLGSPEGKGKEGWVTRWAAAGPGGRREMETAAGSDSDQMKGTLPLPLL